MATSKKEQDTELLKTEEVNTTYSTSYEPTYPVTELKKADLGGKPLTIAAALKAAGKNEYTIKEAKKIVADFKKGADN